MPPTGSSEMVKVLIRRRWNDYLVAAVPYEALEGLQWSRVSGGVDALAPQPFIHAYVWCNEVDGDIAHSCRHGSGPHRIKVCVVRKDNSAILYKMLLAVVGPKPRNS